MLMPPISIISEIPEGSMRWCGDGDVDRDGVAPIGCHNLSSGVVAIGSAIPDCDFFVGVPEFVIDAS